MVPSPSVRSMTRALERTADLQTWSHTLKLQDRLHAEIDHAGASVMELRDWLMRPDADGSCKVTPAQKCSGSARTKYAYLVVMSTYVKSLPFVRIHFDAWMKRFQHLVVSDHILSGTPDDRLVGLRWGTSLAMKSLAGTICAHNRAVSHYDFMT